MPQAGTGAIAPGTPVEARVSALPGRVFEGRVKTLLPPIEVGSRTQQARIVLENPPGLLPPGMFAQVTLDPERGEGRLPLPSEAVVGGGEQKRAIRWTPESR